MATQAALVAETIAGMKRTLSGRYDSSDSDASAERITNRGNKLKRKAEFVQEGQLIGQRAYKKKVDHGGYSRYILSRNPKRYDYYGDELEEEDEDIVADGFAIADNPYSELKIEELLRPLTSARELPNHSSLSHAYTSTVLEQLTKQACDMVQREERTLWQVKKLAMAFRSDLYRVTGEEVCAPTDSGLFGSERSSSVSTEAVRQSQIVGRDEEVNCNNPPECCIPRVEGNFQPAQRKLPSVQTKHGNPSVIDLGVHLVDVDGSVTEGFGEVDIQLQGERKEQQCTMDTEAHNVEPSSKITAESRGDVSSEPLGVAQPDGPSIYEQGSETNPPFHRMTTRAQAQVASDRTISAAPRSVSPTFSESPSSHPIFQIKPSAIPDVDQALPPIEAEDTRTILFLWVQKQEEVVRGAILLYNGLLKADRMRKSVFGWCKAEGHLGEMSDGEDWYDKEEWGLEEDLRKGQEDEEDEMVNQTKKTRGRRAQ